jgi:hypothetical protein
MADLNYDVSVNTSSAEKNLANLQKSVGGINSAFIKFRDTIATISLGAVISSSLRFADSIQDLSDATGIATANILGFSNAVSQNGGTADGAQKAILKLVQSIGDAAGGSLEAQNAFQAVGVTLADLGKLSEQDLLKKTIDGLDKITNSSERSTLTAKLLGKEFRNVKFGELGAAYAAAAAESQRYSGSIAAGAAAQQNLEVTVRKFQTALLEVLKPISEFVAKIDVSVESIGQFIKTVLTVGAALFALTKGLTIVNSLANSWNKLGVAGSALSHNVTMVANSFLGVFQNLGRAVGVFQTSKTSLQLVGFALASLSRSILRFAGLAGLVYSVVEAFSYLEKSVFQTNYVEKGVNGIAIGLEAVTRAAGQLLNLPTNLIGKVLGIDNAVGLGTPLIALAEKAAQARKDAEMAALRGTGQGRGDPKEIANREAAAKAEKENGKNLRDVADALAKRRKEIEQTSGAFADYLKQQNASIYQEASFIGMTEDQVEVLKAQIEVLNKAEEEIKQLQRAKSLLSKDEQALSKVYDSQINKIRELSITGLDAAAQAITNTQSLRAIDKARLQDIENINKAIEDQIGRQQQLGDVLRGINDQRVDLDFQKSIQGLSKYQKEVATIQESARKAALEAGRAYAASFEDTGDGLTPERARELANGLNAIADAYIYISEAQVEALGSSNDMIRGLTEAWDSYKAAALDTASQIKDNFGNFTQGMEDAFVRFAQTGKLSFKDLANSIVADLARIAFKKAVVGMASLFGFAAGGQVMADTPIIVGERGPELFVPRSAGAIVPNNALGGMANRSNEGGGGQTTVNYNIQAVDAASFRSLVARDPSFIYAVTEQGRRSQPTRSR